MLKNKERFVQLWEFFNFSISAANKTDMWEAFHCKSFKWGNLVSAGGGGDASPQPALRWQFGQ